MLPKLAGGLQGILLVWQGIVEVGARRHLLWPGAAWGAKRA